MPRRAVSASLCAAALGLAVTACGSDRDNSSRESPSPAQSSSTSPTPPTPSVSSSPTSSVTSITQGVVARMHAQDGLLGRPRGRIELLGPRGLAAGNKTYLTQGRKHGLVVGSSQHLEVPGTEDAVRTVVAFRTPAGATAMAADLPTGQTRFEVGGMPAAQGAYSTRDKRFTSINVFFTAGPYLYVLGVQPTTAQRLTPTSVGAAARAWLDRVSDLS